MNPQKSADILSKTIHKIKPLLPGPDFSNPSSEENDAEVEGVESWDAWEAYLKAQGMR